MMATPHAVTHPVPLGSRAAVPRRACRRCPTVQCAAQSSGDGADAGGSAADGAAAGAAALELAPGGALWWTGLHSSSTRPVYGETFVLQRPTIGGPGLVRVARQPKPVRRASPAPAPPVVWSAPGGTAGTGLMLAGTSLGSGSVVIDTEFVVLPAAPPIQPNTSCTGIVWQGSAETGEAQAQAPRRRRSRHPRRTQMVREAHMCCWARRAALGCVGLAAADRCRPTLPLPPLQLRFTCNLCGEANDCEVNPHAWRKGSVFARCEVRAGGRAAAASLHAAPHVRPCDAQQPRLTAPLAVPLPQGCTAVHKLRDNLNIFHELAGPVFPPRELRSAYLVQARGRLAGGAGGCASAGGGCGAKRRIGDPTGSASHLPTFPACRRFWIRSRSATATAPTPTATKESRQPSSTALVASLAAQACLPGRPSSACMPRCPDPAA